MVFTELNLSQGYFTFQYVMSFKIYFVCFKSRKKRYKYRQLPQGRASNAVAFHLRIKALLLLTEAIVYVDDVRIRGKTQWEHNKQVRKAIDNLNLGDMHVNDDKIYCSQKKVMFLGYDIMAGGFSLDTYVQEQKEKLPKVSSRA